MRLRPGGFGPCGFGPCGFGPRGFGRALRRALPRPGGFGPRRLLPRRFLPCRFLPCRFLPCRFLPCRFLPCRFLPCRLLPCRLLPCRLLPCRLLQVCRPLRRLDLRSLLLCRHSSRRLLQVCGLPCGHLAFDLQTRVLCPRRFLTGDLLSRRLQLLRLLLPFLPGWIELGHVTGSLPRFLIGSRPRCIASVS